MKNYYYIATYGCQMNVHESEICAGILEEKGYILSNIENADVIVFNTCCIRDNAEKKIIGHIGALKKRKLKNPDMIIAVVGCMTQQIGTKDLLKNKFPYIDIILGASNKHLLSEAIDYVKKNKKFYCQLDEKDKPEIIENCPMERTSFPNSWVDIMYGCNNYCTYCIVPYVRGRERSRESKVIIDEIKRSLDLGYKEITLLGQNVDSYGNDKHDDWDFAKLLNEITKIEGKYRLRFMTSHPKDFNKDIVEIIRANDNICNNIHLPVQSGSNRILKLMNRKYTREHYLEIIDSIKTLPNVGITSDIMVGFPTETEEDFSDTISLVEKVRFSTAFTFVYSPRTGTVASKMIQIPEIIKKERIQKLVALQNKITQEISQEYLGNVEEILIEDKNPKYENVLCGRTNSGRLVNFEGKGNTIGEFVNIKINKTKSSALWGEIYVE